MTLILSLMPGLDLLGMAFKTEGFCVVQGGDVIWGGDVRKEHYPPDKFDGILSGPPCQAFSPLSHMVRHNGHEPKFGNLIPEFERVVSEAAPQWFLMENVPQAPLPAVDGYGVHSFKLNNRQCADDNGEPAVQNRVRRWSFGWLGERRVLLPEIVVFENREFEYAVTGGSARPHGQLGDGNDLKRKRQAKYRDGKGRMPWNAKSQLAFAELCRKQGLPEDFCLPGFTVEAKCKAVGNGVPRAMGLAIARAVKEAIG